jgi:hypothetical protein
MYAVSNAYRWWLTGTIDTPANKPATWAITTSATFSA